MPTRSPRRPAAYHVHCPTGKGSFPKHTPWLSQDSLLAAGVPTGGGATSAPERSGKPISALNQYASQRAPSLHVAVKVHCPLGARTGAVQFHTTLPSRLLGNSFSKCSAVICSVQLVVAGAETATLTRLTPPSLALPVTRIPSLKGSDVELACAGRRARAAGTSATPATTASANRAASLPTRPKRPRALMVLESDLQVAEGVLRSLPRLGS